MKNKIASFILAAAFALFGSSVAKAVLPVVTVPFIAGVSQSQTANITSTPGALFSAALLDRSSVQFDSAGYTQARVVCWVGGTAGNATTTLFVRFQPSTGSSFSDNTFSDYLQLGGTGVDIGAVLGTATDTTFIGPWTNLDAGAIGDDILIIGGVDTANAGRHPFLGSIAIQFR